MTDPHPNTSSGGSGSELRQSLLKSRIAKLPHLPAIAPHRHAATADDAQQDEEADSLGALGMASPASSSKGAQLRRAINADTDDGFSPLSAEDCFQEALEVEVTDARATFRVYYTPPARQVKQSKGATRSQQTLEALAVTAEDTLDEEDNDGGSAGTVFLLHHGAGYSALSFALVAKTITQQTNGRAGVLAYDCRGHGRTALTSQQDAQDLSLSNLTSDGLAVLAQLFPSRKRQPTLILVGHSMGGAVVVSMAHALAAAAAANSTAASQHPRVAGVAVLDVVEGTAMAALPNMKTIVSQLPLGFDSIADAIRWHIDSGTLVNAQSARRSVPSLLKENLTHDPDAAAAPQQEEEEPMEKLSTGHSEDATPSIARRPASSYAYVWRHDLLSTEPHWHGWFAGLSQSFLTCKCARLLLLAGTDRLDKDLMIGQMQGKYQLVVFPEVGHSLQEDAPQRTAQTLIDFWQRNESVNVAAVRGLRKVGQP